MAAGSTRKCYNVEIMGRQSKELWVNCVGKINKYEETLCNSGCEWLIPGCFCASQVWRRGTELSIGTLHMIYER
jgi:hypothetical protein